MKANVPGPLAVGYWRGPDAFDKGEPLPMMSCPDCQTNLDEVPVGAPCPGCGGRRRDANATAEVAEVTVAALRPGLSTRDGDPSWPQQWKQVLACLETLRAAYEADAVVSGTDGVKGLARSFFTECHHFGDDWLKKDVGNLPTIVGANGVEEYLENSPVLNTCEAICNTSKHFRRDRGKTARIGEVAVDPSGAWNVTIEVDPASECTKEIDALELADECVKAWRDFFTRFGITEP